MEDLIQNLKRTCDVCPSQWEFTTLNNTPVYVRYRWGGLSVRVGVPNGDISSAVGGQSIVDTQLGDEYDGVIYWNKIKGLITKALRLYLEEN